MAEMAESHVGLRVFGDSLSPDDVTRLLGKPPTYVGRKGDQTRSPTTGRSRTLKSNAWILDAVVRRPADINAQVRDILDGMSNDPPVWTRLNQNCEIDLFVGLFMNERNEGLELDAVTLLLLGARGIGLSLDIYDPTIDTA